MDKIRETANKAFSAGLGKNGRIAAWVVAIGAVAGYAMYENKDNGKFFSKEEQTKWNNSKVPKNDDAKSGSTS